LKTKAVLFSLALTSVLVGASSCTHRTAAPALSQASGPTASLTPAPTLTLTLQPTATVTATPTEVPMPEGLNFLPPGIIAVRNTDGTWGVGIDEGAQTKAIQGILVDAAGFHLASDGGQIDITAAEMVKRLKIGQASPLQIYNEQETAILFAYDAENKVWVDAAKVLQPDRNNLDSFIKVETQQEFEEIFRLEELLLPPFPKDTYFPLLNEINRDYQEPYDNTPFGDLADLSKAPTRLDVNYILWKDLIIYTEQVYNPADGSFSCLHFALRKEAYSALFDPLFRRGTSFFPSKICFDERRCFPRRLLQLFL
jgi:hypothetical protein